MQVVSFRFIIFQDLYPLSHKLQIYLLSHNKQFKEQF